MTVPEMWELYRRAYEQGGRALVHEIIDGTRRLRMRMHTDELLVRAGVNDPEPPRGRWVRRLWSLRIDLRTQWRAERWAYPPTPAFAVWLMAISAPGSKHPMQTQAAFHIAITASRTGYAWCPDCAAYHAPEADCIMAAPIVRGNVL